MYAMNDYNLILRIICWPSQQSHVQQKVTSMASKKTSNIDNDCGYILAIVISRLSTQSNLKNMFGVSLYTLIVKQQISPLSY